jgi:hypothetical protein
VERCTNDSVLNSIEKLWQEQIAYILVFGMTVQGNNTPKISPITACIFVAAGIYLPNRCPAKIEDYKNTDRKVIL